MAIRTLNPMPNVIRCGQLADSLPVVKVIAMLMIWLGVAVPLAAEEEAAMSLEQAARKVNNPVSDVWLLIGQNDLTRVDTPAGGKWQNRTSFQPVMPVPILDGEYNLVNRIVAGYVSAPRAGDFPSTTYFGAPSDSVDVPDNFDASSFYQQRTSGLTDTVVFSLLAPAREDGWVWGVGPSFILPTASEDVLGQEKWSAGPAALIVRLGDSFGEPRSIESWNIGTLAQHWWDFAGEGDRDDVSQSDIQYFLNYKASPTRLIGMTPNIQIDWEQSGSDRFSVPVGLGVYDVFRWGKVPVRFGVELQYYVMQPDPVGAEWNLKFVLAPISANPFK